MNRPPGKEPMIGINVTLILFITLAVLALLILKDLIPEGFILLDGFGNLVADFAQSLGCDYRTQQVLRKLGQLALVVVIFKMIWKWLNRE